MNRVEIETLYAMHRGTVWYRHSTQCARYVHLQATLVLEMVCNRTQISIVSKLHQMQGRRSRTCKQNGAPIHIHAHWGSAEKTHTNLNEKNAREENRMKGNEWYCGVYQFSAFIAMSIKIVQGEKCIVAHFSFPSYTHITHSSNRILFHQLSLHCSLNFQSV